MRISDWSSDVCSSDLVEVLAQRIIWSLPLCFVIMLFRRQIGEYLAVLKDWRTLRLLLASALLIAVNWLVYIYSIFTDTVLAARLGYYLNPLVKDRQNGVAGTGVYGGGNNGGDGVQ